MHTIIGVREEEQSVKQPLIINLSFGVDIDAVASQDFLDDGHCDYAKIANQVVSFVEKTRCQLLETLAKQLSTHLKEQFFLNSLWLQIIKKPMDMPGVDVAVEVFLK